MSLLLEILGGGLLGDLLSAFEGQLPICEEDDSTALRSRRRECPDSVDLALRHGVAALRRMRLAESRSAFEDAARLAPRSAKPRLGLACVEDELGRLDAALRHLFVAHEFDPGDPAIVFSIAFCLERDGGMDKAELHYRRAIALCPRLRNAHERLAAIALRRRDLEEARRCYAQLAEIEPDDVEILMALASLNLATGRALDAVALFERALLVEPQCTEDELDDADSVHDSTSLARAIEKLSAFARKYPGIPDFHVHLGDLHVKAGNADQAILEYETALRLQPRSIDALIKLGTQQLRLSRYIDAAQTFNRAVELNDRVVAAYVGLGVAQEDAGRDAEAAATFDLASSVEPNTTLLFAETTRLQLKADRHARAERQRRERIDPPVAAAKEDLLEEQIRRHRQALAMRPNHADLHYRFGLLLKQSGDVEGAMKAFRDAIAINPAYLKATVKLGICLRQSGRADEALDVFRRALSIRDDVIDAHYELGLLFAQRNRFDLAVEEFERALEARPQSVALRANLALALQSLGMLDRASAAWRSICELAREYDQPSEPASASADA